MCVMISVLSFVVVCCGRLTTLCLISVRKIARALLAVPLISPSGSIVLQLIVSFFYVLSKETKRHPFVIARLAGERMGNRNLLCVCVMDRLYGLRSTLLFSIFFFSVLYFGLTIANSYVAAVKFINTLIRPSGDARALAHNYTFGAYAFSRCCVLVFVHNLDEFR